MLNLSYKAISANCVLKMDSNEINKFAKQFGLNKFLGVFAVDELSLIPKTRHGLVIFNTDTSQSVGQHWLALCITKTKIFYFDSLNSKFQYSSHFTDFMKYTKKELVWNTIQIQSDISEKCGIHCLVFCYAMQKYKNKRSYANFLKTFLDLSIDEREHLSVYYFNLINQICSV